MAHFAELDENNIVKRVVVVNNDVLLDDNGNESEIKGIEFLTSLYGSGTWKQTSYNKTFRGGYAGPGKIYNPIRDVFMSPRPFPSWTYDEENNTWKPPIPHPDVENKLFLWDEITQVWVEV